MSIRRTYVRVYIHVRVCVYICTTNNTTLTTSNAQDPPTGRCMIRYMDNYTRMNVRALKMVSPHKKGEGA